MISSSLEPGLASSSDGPFSSTTGLVAEWARELDKGFAHGCLVSHPIVNFGRILTIVYLVSHRDIGLNGENEEQNEDSLCGVWCVCECVEVCYSQAYRFLMESEISETYRWWGGGAMRRASPINAA